MKKSLKGYVIVVLALMTVFISGCKSTSTDDNKEDTQEIEQKVAIYNDTGQWINGSVEDYELLNKINSIDEGRSDRFLVVLDGNEPPMGVSQSVVRVFDKLENDLYFIYSDKNTTVRGVGQSSLLLHVEENIQLPE